MKKNDIYRSQFRLPNSIFEQLKASSEKNKRTLNAELVYRLQISLADDAYSDYKEIHGITEAEERETLKTLDLVNHAKKAVSVQALESTDDIDKEISRLTPKQRGALLSFLRTIK